MAAASPPSDRCGHRAAGCRKTIRVVVWCCPFRVAGDGEYQIGAHYQGGGDMATGETGFDDVTFDLISLQYHSLKAGHDYGQYVRDAKNAGLEDVASFFEDVMSQDSQRAHRCPQFLRELAGTDNTSPQR